MKSTLNSLAVRAMPQMSRPMRMLLATLAVAVVGSLAQNAFAEPMGHRGGMHGMRGGMGMEGPGMMGGRMLDLVNATAEQRTQIKTIMDAARTDLKASHESSRTLRQQMQTAFAQPTVDARAVETLRVQMQALHETKSKRMTQAMLDMSRVLTPEQRRTLSEAMAKRQALMQRHAAERAALGGKPAAK